MDARSNSMHILMLPWLAFGHTIPFAELAKRIARQGHRVTFFSTPRNAQRLVHVPPDLSHLIHVLAIPLPRIEHLPDHAEATIDLPSDELRPYLRRAYDASFTRSLSQFLQESSPSKPDWILFDYAAYWVPAVAAEHSVPCAFLSLFSAAVLGFYGPVSAFMGGRYARTKPEHFTAVPEYVPFPTTVAYRDYEARELFRPCFLPDAAGVSEIYRFGKAIEGCQLVAVRSSTGFEPEWLRLLRELYQKPVIPVGLFPPPPEDVAGNEATMQWLDAQAPGSVIYAAFGSEVKLMRAQLREIALGLELSGLPFIWAFRAPVDPIDGSDGLPDGFKDRANGRGVVCTGWVPQVRFLAHRSVGGFLTHAGWNSITEGLAQGVKLVLLPLMFEQGLNARHLAEKKISIEVPRDMQDGTFAAEDIAKAMRSVMVEAKGEELGINVKECSKIFGDEEMNDQCVREFLKYLSEYRR